MEPCLSKQSYMRVPEGQCAHWWIASIVALPLGSGLRGLTLWARGARCHPGLFSALMAGRVAQVAGGTARRGKDIRGGRPCEAVQARAPEGLVLAWARHCVNCEAEPAGVHGAQLLVCARAFLAAPPGVPLAMLQGPPGSGKTTTGAVLARALANFARERGTALATLHVAQTIAEARKLLQVCRHLVIDAPRDSVFVRVVGLQEAGGKGKGKGTDDDQAHGGTADPSGVRLLSLHGQCRESWRSLLGCVGGWRQQAPVLTPDASAPCGRGRLCLAGNPGTSSGVPAPLWRPAAHGRCTTAPTLCLPRMAHRPGHASGDGRAPGSVAGRAISAVGLPWRADLASLLRRRGA